MSLGKTNSVKRILTALTLSTISLTAAASANARDFAVGDVFYCDTIKSVGWVWKDEKQFKNYRPEKFKFSIVDLKTIKFGSGGSFADYSMGIEYMYGTTLKTKDDIATLRLEGSEFLFSSAHFFGGSFQAATCDRF